MNKQIKTILLAGLTVFVSTVKAQTVEDGKRFFQYERYTSAKNVLTKLASDLNNTEAVYWLGQTELAMGDSAMAKELYQKASKANPGNPLLLVGLGHLELVYGQTQDARQAFETAISLSKGKSVPVFDAIGYANIHTTAGDVSYALDKLKQATMVKGFKDADVYVNIGDAYMKMVDGGNALTAYQSAADLDPKSPIPPFKMGKLYETQGPSQQEIFVSDYGDAMAKDPAFGPVYYDLYSYFYRRDINKSRDYLDKYIDNSDPDPADCYYEASILFASGMYKESISKSNDCIASDTTNPYPNLLGLKAYSYFSLGDTANAKVWFEKYFAKQKPAKVGPTDYTTYAQVLLAYPGNDSLAGVYVDMAIAKDTLEADKLNEAKVLLSYYTAKNDMNGIGTAYKKIISSRARPVNSDFQSAGFYFYKGGNYAAAADVFDSATKFFPNDLYDNYMLGKSLSLVDPDMKTPAAKPAFEKVIQLGSADTVANKAQLIGSYQYLVEYYINVLKDKDTALAYCDKILALDPTNAETIKNREIIAKLKVKPAAGK